MHNDYYFLLKDFKVPAKYCYLKSIKKETKHPNQSIQTNIYIVAEKYTKYIDLFL